MYSSVPPKLPPFSLTWTIEPNVRSRSRRHRRRSPRKRRTFTEAVTRADYGSDRRHRHAGQRGRTGVLNFPCHRTGRKAEPSVRRRSRRAMPCFRRLIRIPNGRAHGCREIGAVGARADSALEVVSERGVVLMDPADRLANRSCDPGSGALWDVDPARRSRPLRPTARVELADEELSFCVCLFLADLIAVGTCLLDVVVDFGEATPVGGLGLSVEHIAGVAERGVRSVRVPSAETGLPDSAAARSSTWNSRPG